MAAMPMMPLCSTANSMALRKEMLGVAAPVGASAVWHRPGADKIAMRRASEAAGLVSGFLFIRMAGQVRRRPSSALKAGFQRRVQPHHKCKWGIQAAHREANRI